MTMRERELCGLLFDAHSEELTAIKRKAHRLSAEYDALDETDPRRTEIVKELLGGAGENVCFLGPIRFNYGINTFIGNDFFANFGLTVLDDARVSIGDHVMMGPNVSIMASTHPLLASEREDMLYPDGHRGMSEIGLPITIGSHVWLACGVIVCGGVTIGDGAVIGAGSVVTEDMPAGWLSAGVPCRPIRPITEKDSKLGLV